MVEAICNYTPAVLKNDQCTLAQLAEASHLILSPGPGIPDEAGMLKNAITALGATHKILGVCLGFQAIGEVYGGRLKNLNTVYHGIQSDIVVTDTSDPILGGLPSPFPAGRYHSWAIDSLHFPSVLSVSATDGNGEIMAGRHRNFQVYGVQFHPESIMTPDGLAMIRNFLLL